ncbi:PREDICTED: uncharacterized protein LOC104759891 [Camelina sativa]|uniref:Uncharacterized protein LOC104759891 n=1 Tax=Camelina sativa TaxID=90675 RepID=A0ABM0X5K9_CAMSA|nr:PREDICTED: uncharacterized protein LOC104759891 [Camelina sativa]
MKGKYKGCLVAASGQDGNMQIFPLAFGVVEVENDSGWVWFFKHLQQFVPDEEDLVFVSDRHASFYSALGKVYPLAHHVACAVHLFRNVKHKFKCGGLASMVSKAARAYTIGDFEYWWKEIENRKPACAIYLREIGLSHWTLFHFFGNRYNVMSSNISESLNAAMVRAVDYPIVSMVEFIRAMLMRWFWCRRTKALDFENKTYTFRRFDVLKIPCCHALAASQVRGVDKYTLVDEIYFVGPWTNKYKGIIMPVPNEKDMVVPETCTEVDVNPPNTKRGGGRPRKKRIPSQGEGHHGKQKGGKQKKIRKCGRCFKVGHNRKTCSTLI